MYPRWGGRGQVPCQLFLSKPDGLIFACRNAASEMQSKLDKNESPGDRTFSSGFASNPRAHRRGRPISSMTPRFVRKIESGGTDRKIDAVSIVRTEVGVLKFTFRF